MSSGSLGLEIVEGVRIDETTKGFPSVADPIPLRSVGDQAWTLADLQPPVMVLREPPLRHNVRLMADYCAEHGVDLAPHGKTTMAPQLWSRQIEAGAWGLTAATVQQARVMRACNVPRILIANEIADDGAIHWVGEALAEGTTEFLCQVDSLAGVELLDAHLRRSNASRSLGVLVELGHEGGRAGCRTVEEAAEVAAVVRRSGTLQLAGITAYEGSLGPGRSPEQVSRVERFLERVRRLTEELLAGGHFDGRDVLLSAGGSIYFDVVVERLGGWPVGSPVRVLLRSGCYLTHDADLYERNSPFARNADAARRFHDAIDVFGVVLSRPEPDVAIVGVGRRDVPYDQRLPIPRSIRRTVGHEEEVDAEGLLTVLQLNDQHAICRAEPELRVEVGDLVSFGVSHPCTAFDKWRVIPVLDADDRVIDAIATFF